MSWKELRTRVKNCEFTDCPRNKNKLPILFDRKESSLSKIKFVVVSQEPGVSLKRGYSNSDKIEEYLIGECASNLPPKNKRGVPYRMREIFGKKFNPKTDEIYWTHALKCVPAKSNKDIINEWENCALSCIKHFKNELNLIPSKKLVIIVFGNYALTLCKHVFKEKRLAYAKGIVKYIREIDLEKKFYFGEKEIFLFPFLHPSNRNRLLKEDRRIYR